MPSIFFHLPRRNEIMPRIFYINSSTDYWTRAASLLHTDVQGKKDLAIDPHVRMYAIAGRAHTSGRIGIIGRALLTAMDEWLSRGITPPDSRIPKISDNPLVTLAQFKKTFPKIPGSALPPSLYQPYRLDHGPRWETQGIKDNVPPKIGEKYVCLVPQVDKDGNEIAGIHLPEISAPLATYTGWSLRPESFSNTLRRNAGKIWPLPGTKQERLQKRDPRLSIVERFPTKADYMFAVSKSVLNLKHQRLLLDEDVTMLLTEAAEQDFWPPQNQLNQVNISEFSIVPGKLQPGDSARMTVEFTGKGLSVIKVFARVRENNRITYQFNDRGLNGDEIAGDRIWTGNLIVYPWMPPKTYHLVLEARDIHWNPIFRTADSDTAKNEVAVQEVRIE